MYTAEQISQATAARTREEYEAIDALNQTGAKLLLKAPAKYAYDKANPRKDSKALREGIMTHVAVLEPADVQHHVDLLRAVVDGGLEEVAVGAVDGLGSFGNSAIGGGRFGSLFASSLSSSGLDERCIATSSVI